MTEISNENELPPLEIRHGIKALARYIRKTERQAYYLVTNGEIPARRVGGRWTWVPSEVRRALMGESA